MTRGVRPRPSARELIHEAIEIAASRKLDAARACALALEILAIERPDLERAAAQRLVARFIAGPRAAE